MDFPLKTIHFGYPHLWQNPHMNLIEFRHYLHRILVFTSYTTGFALHAWWAWGHLPCRESPPCCLMCIPVGGLWFRHHIYIYHIYIPYQVELYTIYHWKTHLSLSEMMWSHRPTVLAFGTLLSKQNCQAIHSLTRNGSVHLIVNHLNIS